MSKQVLIRAATSLSIGLAHFRRAYSLGAILSESNFDVHIQTNESNPLLSQLSTDHITSISKLSDKSFNSPKDLALLKEYAHRINAHWIVLDGYNYNSEYEQDILKEGFKLFRIDDLPTHNYFCNVLLNQNFDAENMNFTLMPNTIKAFGLNYLILSEKFRSIQYLKKTIPHDDSFNILISLGGASNLTHQFVINIAESLKRLNKESWKITFVVPGDPTTLNRIRKILEGCSSAIEFLDFTNDLPEIMSKSDFAITSGGATMWELIYMGVPFHAISLSKPQEDYLTILNIKGVCKHLNRSSVLEPEHLDQALITAYENRDYRRDLIELYDKLINRNDLTSNLIGLFVSFR